MNMPLAADGWFSAFSCTMASITGVVDKMEKPVITSIRFQDTGGMHKQQQSQWCDSQCPEQHFLRPSQSERVPADKTPATPNASYKARAAPPYQRLPV